MLDYLAAALTIANVLMTSKKLRATWIVAIAGAVAWAAYAIFESWSGGILIMEAILICLDVRGFIMWGRPKLVLALSEPLDGPPVGGWK